MSVHRLLMLPAASAAILASVSLTSAVVAQDLADRGYQLQVRRSALMEYWATQQQVQTDQARYRSPAQFGQYGQRYGAQPLLGYRAYGPQKPFGAAPLTSSSVVAANGYCVGPLGIECSPLDCDCDPLDSCY